MTIHELKKMIQLLDRAKDGKIIVANNKIITVYKNNHKSQGM